MKNRVSRFFYGVPGMAYILLVKVQPRVFVTK